MKNNNGGPAFPVPHPYEAHSTGLTLRDWFAGQALIHVQGQDTLQEAAKQAYEIADAMLEQREK